jgi:heme exporter protein C
MDPIYYAVIAGVTAPFFLFVMPRVMSGLHPGSAGDASGATPVAQLRMPPNMLLIFLASLLGFTLLYFWLLNLRVRTARLTDHHPKGD